MSTARRAKLFLLLGIGIFCHSTMGFGSSLDLSATLNLRSHPYGGTLALDGGLSFKPWVSETSDPLIFYSLIRPGGNFSSALSYNAAELYLDLFPISFLGLRLSRQWVQNKKDYPAYDCEIYQCQGQFHRSSIEFRGALAYKNFFGLLRSKKIQNLKTEDSLESIEEFFALPANEGEDLTVSTLIVGYELKKDFRVFLLSIQGKSERNHKSDFKTLNISFPYNYYEVTLGAGLFDSDLTRKDFTGLLRVSRPLIMN